MIQNERPGWVLRGLRQSLARRAEAVAPIAADAEFRQQLAALGLAPAGDKGALWGTPAHPAAQDSASAAAEWPAAAAPILNWARTHEPLVTRAAAGVEAAAKLDCTEADATVQLDAESSLGATTALPLVTSRAWPGLSTGLESEVIPAGVSQALRDLR